MPNNQKKRELSPESLGAKEVSEVSPEALGAVEVTPESLGATPVEEELSLDTVRSLIKKGLTPEQQSRIKELMAGKGVKESKIEAPDIDIKGMTKAAGYGALQGLPFIGTWTDEMLDQVGVSKEEIREAMAKYPGISTTAEVLSALAIPVPAPNKLRVLGKLGAQALEAGLTGAGAAKEGERLSGAATTAGLATGISGLGALGLKGVSKVGDKAKARRVEKEFIEQAEKEAAERLRNPKTLLGIDDPNRIPKSLQKAQAKFEVPTHQIEEVAVRRGITDNPRNLSKAYEEVSQELDDAYKSVDDYLEEPVSEVLDNFITEFKRDARVVVGERTGPIIKASENKLAQAEERLAEAIDAGAKPVDVAVLEDRVEKLTDELTAANIIERLRPTYKSTVKEFNELADKMEGQTSIQKLVDIKNQLFKDAKSNEAKLAVAHKFNNYLQEYVEKNTPAQYLEPWMKAKEDWKTVRLIQDHLADRLGRNYSKAFPDKAIEASPPGVSDRVAKALLQSGYNIRNLFRYPVSTSLGFIGKGFGEVPKVAESAGDLAEKILQSKRVPSRGVRGLEHLIQSKQQNQSKEQSK